MVDTFDRQAEVDRYARMVSIAYAEQVRISAMSLANQVKRPS